MSVRKVEARQAVGPDAKTAYEARCWVDGPGTYYIVPEYIYERMVELTIIAERAIEEDKE